MIVDIYQFALPTYLKLSRPDKIIIKGICAELCCDLEYAAECYLMFDKNLEATKRYIKKELLGARYNMRK